MRKKILVIVSSFIILTGYFCFNKIAAAQHPRDMNFEPVKFNPPKGKRAQLKNGVVLYILEDHELPLLNLSAKIRIGSIYDPPDKSGLAELTGTVMRTGGAGSMSGKEINDQLEYIGGSIEVAFGRESGSAALSVMKEDLAIGIEIFADILMNPRFSSEKFDLAKKQKIEEIRRQNDNPENIAFREFKKILYRDNPRGRIPTVDSIRKINRQDLIAFHGRFFYPENVMFAISGDFQEELLVKKLEEAFGEWDRGEDSLPEIALLDFPPVKSVNYAYKDVSQSTIVSGHLTINKTHPDYFIFNVLNFILGGGGFNSRLISEIRSNQGLAYSVGSFYRAEPDYGVFAVLCMTKSKTTARAISLIYQIIDEVKKNGVTKEELRWAKDSIINKYIFNFNSSARIVNQEMNLEFTGLPPDFLEKYRDNIARVSLEDIKRVAAGCLHPDKSVLMVVGKEEDFDGNLTDFGKVHRIETDKP